MLYSRSQISAHLFVSNIHCIDINDQKEKDQRSKINEHTNKIISDFDDL